MGAADDIDVENTAGVAHAGGIEISQLIREEVRAVVREQILGTASEPAPPSYDSAATLLATDAARLLNDTLDATETALQDTGKLNPRRRGWLFRLPAWLRLVIGLGPIFTVVFSLPVICLSGIDPLFLCAAAFILLCCTYSLTMFLAFFISIVTNQGPKKAAEGTEQQAPQVDKDSDMFAPLFIALHPLLTYILFNLILWLWFVWQEGSLFSRFQVSTRFDAKIDAHDALSGLTACFYDKFPDRNVTIQDFTLCLTELGMDLAPK